MHKSRKIFVDNMIRQTCKNSIRSEIRTGLSPRPPYYPTVADTLVVYRGRASWGPAQIGGYPR
jgi:hypothetical protein